jgi:hypothetical protein
VGLAVPYLAAAVLVGLAVGLAVGLVAAPGSRGWQPAG